MIFNTVSQKQIDEINSNLSELEQKVDNPTFNVGVEEVIGTYKGKPLYRKILSSDSVTIGGGTTTLDTSIKSNTHTIVDIRGSARRRLSDQGGAWISASFYYNNAMAVTVTTNGVVMNVGAGMDIIAYNIILEYTKN